MPAAGVQVKVPAVFAALGVKVALWPAGRPETSATREAIASPSGSEAWTVKLIGAPSLAPAVAGAVTIGARSLGAAGTNSRAPRSANSTGPEPVLGVLGSSTRARFSDRKSTRLNSSHLGISYAVFCLKKKT